MAGKEKEGDGGSKMLYTPVLIVREKEMLLVKECSDHLGQFGLTLWVVSMNQMPRNCNILNGIQFPCGMPDKKKFKYICMSQFLDVHGTVEFLYAQELLFAI